MATEANCLQAQCLGLVTGLATFPRDHRREVPGARLPGLCLAVQSSDTDLTTSKASHAPKQLFTNSPKQFVPIQSIYCDDILTCWDTQS